MHRPPVQRRAAAADGGERLAPAGIVHHGDHAAVGVLARDRDRPHRIREQVVGGAVERVDHPDEAGAARGAAALLGHHAVVGPRGGDAVEHQPLGRPVGVRHHVGGAALRLHPARRAPEPLEQERARVAGGAEGELEQGVGGHGPSVIRRTNYWKFPGV